MRTTSRLAAFRAIWRVLSGASKPDTPGLGERLRAFPRMLTGAVSGRYPGQGRWRPALILLGLVYLVSPVDLVPELLLSVLGLVDDAVVAVWIAGAFLVESERFLGWERSTRPTLTAGPFPADGPSSIERPGRAG